VRFVCSYIVTTGLLANNLHVSYNGRICILSMDIEIFFFFLFFNLEIFFLEFFPPFSRLQSLFQAEYHGYGIKDQTTKRDRQQE